MTKYCNLFVNFLT